MSVSGVFLTLAFGTLGCAGLPSKCKVEHPSFIGKTVLCNRIGLTTFPDGIPSDTEHLEVSYNTIRSVTTLPSLSQLRKLYMTENAVTFLSWEGLRNFPALQFLHLSGNRLRYVKLDCVIEHLPMLRYVTLGHNRLRSFSESELGWPQVSTAVIVGNPFHCDCDLLWLIDKLTCLQACGEGDQTCCSSCAACFLALSLKIGYLHCETPSRLKHVSLTDVSAKMQECREQAVPSTTSLGISQYVSEAASSQVASNRTVKAENRVGQAQAMASTTLQGTSRNDTRPKPTETSEDAATYPTEGTSSNFTSTNILLSGMAGTLSCVTLMILCHRLYKRKCYCYIPNTAPQSGISTA
ncbi:hypothetical protein Bbelb_245050 [Branchiostoma belcheri]|nr:hypothetical protein Bbelb_245050 [Branchiostoma belcheri]